MSNFHGVAEESNAEITAVCDIWAKNLDRGAKQVQEWWGKEPRKCRHLDEILALKDLDGLIVATADFQHAKMLAQTVRAGKDIYCEKPMANDLHDGKDALKAVEETGRIVQIGTQRRSEGIWPAAAEMIRSGILGTISKVECEWNYFGPRWRRDDVDEVKEQDTDWKAFLMGKKYRPWDPHQYMEWRLYKDFSGGIPDQWMSHIIDVVHLLTGEQFPKSVVAHGGTYVWKDGRENGDTFHALLEYPKGFLVSYSTKFGNSAGDGMKIYGTNGTLDCNTWKITGEGGGGDGKIKEEIVIQPQPNVSHMKNWLDCVRSRKPTNADIHAGYSHALAIIMATRALHSGKKVSYDPVKQEMHEA
jgi:predicted dehydrogenase